MVFYTPKAEPLSCVTSPIQKEKIKMVVLSILNVRDCTLQFIYFSNIIFNYFFATDRFQTLCCYLFHFILLEIMFKIVIFWSWKSKGKLLRILKILTIFKILVTKVWDHLLSTYVKFSEKPTFLTPWYAHASVRIRG